MASTELDVSSDVISTDWIEFLGHVVAAGAGFWSAEVVNGVAKQFLPQANAIPFVGSSIVPLGTTAVAALAVDQLAPSGLEGYAGAFTVGYGASAGLGLIRNLMSAVPAVGAQAQAAAQMAAAQAQAAVPQVRYTVPHRFVSPQTTILS